MRAGPGREQGAGPPKNQQSSPLIGTISPTTSTLSSPDSSEPDLTGQDATTLLSSSSPASRPYKEIILLETDFRERFIKGGGNGGQKINKTNSNVELKHYETGIVIHCQATRSLSQNRKLARRILIGRLDEYYNGEMSKRGQKAEKIRKRKTRMARKSAKKYHSAGATVDDHEVDDEMDDEVDDETENTAVAHSEGEAGTELEMKAELEKNHVPVPESAIQLTTLDEILARDNKKHSRRKMARKD